MAIQPSKRIPTNVVTGFLGVGKTTAIRHLLKSKPVDEQWAVLVNEFGEVGIDGALLQANDDMVTQVAGGCTCCKVQSLSRVALQHLIDEHKPDRLIIEPTGLAMPKQIMEMLGTEEFLAQLEVQAMVCLVDPYFFKDESFLNMEACADQIAMADVVIATKADIADEEDLAATPNTWDGTHQPSRPLQRWLTVRWTGVCSHTHISRNGPSPPPDNTRMRPIRPRKRPFQTLTPMVSSGSKTAPSLVFLAAGCLPPTGRLIATSFLNFTGTSPFLA